MNQVMKRLFLTMTLTWAICLNYVHASEQKCVDDGVMKICNQSSQNVLSTVEFLKLLPKLKSEVQYYDEGLGRVYCMQSFKKNDRTCLFSWTSYGYCEVYKVKLAKDGSALISEISAGECE